jgi:hypothetical protein
MRRCLWNQESPIGNDLQAKFGPSIAEMVKRSLRIG